MKKQLLIVDDDEAIRRLLFKILDGEGYTCSAAEDALSARELLKCLSYDLILCDIILPGESGVDLVRFCREEYPDMGVIMVTGIENPKFAKEVSGLGAYGYIIKPFANNQLLITVDNALRRCELEKERKQQSERLESMVRKRTSELQNTIRYLEEAKNRIQENETKFRIVIEKAHDGIAMTRRGRHIYANQNFLKMFGYDQANGIIGHSLNEIVHPDETARLKDMYDRRNRGEKIPNRYSFKALKKSGEAIMVEVSVVRVDYQGEKTAFAFFRDVTENTRFQRALKESEKRLKAILENAPAGIKIVDAESRRIVDINRAGEEMIGISREMIIGGKCCDFVCPESKDHCPVMDSGEEIHHREAVISRSDGKSIQVTKTTVPVSLEGRSHLIDIFVDISRHKKAEAEVRKAHREKAQIIKSIPSILIGVTGKGLVNQCNPLSEKVFGISARDILGRPFSQCGIQWDWAKVKPAVAHCLNTKTSVSLEKVGFSGSDGKEGFLGLTFTPLECDDADSFGFLLMGADITSRIMLELELDQARKLEAIGQLAAGIAHEINTPTQYVGDNINFFQDAFNDLKPACEHYKMLYDRLLEEGGTKTTIEEMKENIIEGDMDYLLAEIPQALEQALEGVGRIATIVHSMKEFSHPGVKEKTSVDINRAIENTVVISRNEWKYVARLETDLDTQLPHVLCLPAEVNQVILNMITNAAHAISEVAGDRADEIGLIKISTRTKGNFVEIRFQDTGTGISEEIKTRVFDPFFTTKEVGKGTGQGLAISRSIIVDKHGGTLSFETEQGKGTTFSIHLPIESE